MSDPISKPDVFRDRAPAARVGMRPAKSEASGAALRSAAARGTETLRKLLKSVNSGAEMEARGKSSQA